MSIGAVSNSLSTPNALLAGMLGPGALSSAYRLRPTDAVSPADRVVPNPRQGNDIQQSARSDQNSAAYQTNNDGDSVHLSSQLDQLSDKEKQQVEKLKARDQEVRTHEQAHMAAAGGLANGGINYEYTTGPDGERYATGGSVSIDTSPGRTPEQTIQKAQQIRRAALAPAEPSGADRAVAAKASKMEAEARRELNEQRNTKEGESINPASGAPYSDATAAKLDAPRLDLVA